MWHHPVLSHPQNRLLPLQTLQQGPVSASHAHDHRPGTTYPMTALPIAAVPQRYAQIRIFLGERRLKKASA